MWYLEWTSGKSENSGNESTHMRDIPQVTQINQQREAKEHAINIWEEVCFKPIAIRELYRDPQLVWKESLLSGE